MKQILNTLLIITIALSCKNSNSIENHKMRFLVDQIPDTIPITFKQDLIPKDKIIHRGVFSPNFEEYYYTISNKNFEQFTIYSIQKINGKWSTPKKAFFNSDYNDHGMSFSSDGKSLYFSSTRPVNIEGVASTWHIWKSEKKDNVWSTPEYVDIPNLRDKLVSHPSVTNSGTLYFHVSNTDYSEMDIYSSKLVNGKFQNAQKLIVPQYAKVGKCTPYIAPKEDYIIFATIGNQLDLIISFMDKNGKWTHTKKLPEKVNTLGQGNPCITPDHKFLFFATGDHIDKNWSVKWVNIESELKKNQN